MIELFVLATEKSHWTRTDSEGHLHDSKLWRNSCGCVWRPREVRRGCDYPRRRSRIRLYRERDRRRKSVKKSRSPSAPSERKAPRRPRTMQVLLSPSLLSHTTMTQSVTNWADQSSRNQWSHASSPPKNWSKRMDETRDPIAIFCFDFRFPFKRRRRDETPAGHDLESASSSSSPFSFYTNFPFYYAGELSCRVQMKAIFSKQKYSPLSQR